LIFFSAFLFLAAGLNAAEPRTDPERVGQALRGGGPPFMDVFALTPDDDRTIYGLGQESSRSTVFRSTDAGASWMPLATGPDGERPGDLEVDPNDPARLFASTSNPGDSFLYRSLDSGATWTLVATFSPGYVHPHSIAFDPANPRSLYVALSMNPRFARSDDGGETWRELPAPFLGEVRLEVETDGALLAVASNGGFRSASGGHSWDLVAPPPPDCPHLTALVVDPEDPDRMVAGTGALTYSARPFGGYDLLCGGIFVTEDGGRTWDASDFHEAFVSALVMGPCEGSPIYATDLRAPGFSWTPWDYSGWISTSRDGGRTWETSTGASTPRQLGLADGCRRLYVNAGGSIVHLDARQPPLVGPRAP
jgi:hypothetical protein